MAVVVEIEVDDNGTPKITKFEQGTIASLKNIEQQSEKTQKTGFQKLGDVVNKISGGITKFASLAVSGLKVLGAAAISVFGAFFVLDKLFKKVTEVSAVAFGFEQMSIAAGGATKVLQDAGEATQGLVTDLDLMRQFNNAVALGVVNTSEEFASLTKSALVLGRALGVGPQRAIDSLVIGIGRQSRLMLDNLGIIVSVEQANKNWAAANNRTVQSMTLAETKAAFLEETYRQLEEATSTLGGLTLFTSDRFNQFKVSLTNTFNEVLLGIGNSKVLADSFVLLGNALARSTEGMDAQRLSIIGTAKVVKLFISAVEIGAKILVGLVGLGEIFWNVLKASLLGLSAIINEAVAIPIVNVLTAVGVLSKETGKKLFDSFRASAVTAGEAIDKVNDVLAGKSGAAASIASFAFEAEQLGVELSKVSNSATLFTKEQREQNAEAIKTINFTKNILADTQSLTEAYKSGRQGLVDYIKAAADKQKITLTEVELNNLITRSIEKMSEAVQLSKEELKEQREVLAEIAKQDRDLTLKFDNIFALQDRLSGTFREGLAQIKEEYDKWLVSFGDASLSDAIFKSFDTENINQSIATFAQNTKQAFLDLPLDLINTASDAIAGGFTAIGESLGGGEQFDGKKLLGNFLKTLGLMAIQLGTAAILAGALGSTAPVIFEAIAPKSLIPLGTALVVFGIGLTAAGAALSKGKKEGGGSSSESRQRRERQRQQGGGGNERGQAQVIVMGDFIGDERFATKLAEKITTIGKERNVTVEVSNARTAQAGFRP